ncbi:glycosyltransferase family 20 protein [Aulographum hederae CBS 113979]|uniref:Glycosyltransferase family 20 protein n=1 Tax=Aulographum hederae CBS 113979 TaxID=1176131 RepID=A0A6G1H3Z0_9PEZI|nr:glycosyltransferase family 20 protein [Aulographum hederae CBS 113979]
MPASTFVVGLFLPYTVDFHENATPRRGSTPPAPTANVYERKDSTIDAKPTRLQVERTASLFNQPTPPRTPSVSGDNGEFFAQNMSAATHFFRAHDPRSLVRSDSHVPEWGSALPFFNQPRSRAGAPPPDNILDYVRNNEMEKQREARRKSKSPHGKRMSKSRSTTRDPWGTEWTVEPAVQGNGAMANAVRAATNAGSMNDIIWLGTVGFPTDALDEDVRAEIHEKLETEFDALTVFVNDTDFDGHYAHYCKTILWPVFHYQIPDHPKSKAYEDHSWIYYVNLNQAFADKIVKSYKRGDIVWVHDYHLLLVPGMVRKKLPDAQIGFFLHTAFPSSEVFRCLSVRKDLLEGMLGANLVAFQSPEYAEHFLTTCSRLLIVEATGEGVQLENHFVNVISLPIGIDPQGLGELRKEQEVQQWISVMEQKYKDKLLIVARDKLDHVRGVRQKLLAFELFLNKYPEYRDKVVLIQVATSTSWADNPELAATVSDIVTRIDSQHSTLAHQPLVFLRQDIPFSQYLALLSVANVLMVTSLREGMNLTCHEYICCQDGAASNKKHGPVILSEFTGCASIFGGNELSINPWDYQKCADAIKEALAMGPEEKKHRYERLREVVLSHTGEYWATNLVQKLAQAHEEHYSRDTMSIPRLSPQKLAADYKASQMRVFLLDYEGTLASFSNPDNVHLSSPQRVLDTMNDILSDDRNIVYVMSGRTPESLERLFSRVPNIGLIAENGCFVREFGSDEWISFPELEKMKEWKEGVKGMLAYYQERVEGSWIEEKHCSVVFHYENADDMEAASRQAGDCANHINDACESQKVHAIPTEKTVLIEPYEWSKGSAAEFVMSNLSDENEIGEKTPRPDFLMVAGNDREDEVIFRWANALSKKESIKHVTSVSVGRRNTEAMATLTQGTSGLLSVLTRLTRPR